MGLDPFCRKSIEFLGLVASTSSLLISNAKTHYFSISFSWLRWKLAREAFLHFAGLPSWIRKAYFFISAQLCGPILLIFVRLDVRKLLFPFVRSFPLFSSEVLKIETSMKNRNLPNLKNRNFLKLRNGKFLKMKNRNLLKMKNRNFPEMRNEKLS